jgi:hypothetical protein
MILRLLVQLRHQIRPTCRKFANADRLLGSTSCDSIHIDEHDGEGPATEGFCERTGARHDLGDRVHGREGNDTLLQIDDDEGGLRIKNGNGHEARFPRI